MASGKGRRCKICAGEHRDAITVAMLDGKTNREIVRTWTDPPIHEQDASHHRLWCVKGHRTGAPTTWSQIPTVTRLQRLDGHIKKLVRKAEDTGQLNPALKGIAERLRVIELQAKLAGELKDTSITFVMSQDWAGLRARILLALKPYPEASAAVVAAFRESFELAAQQTLALNQPPELRTLGEGTHVDPRSDPYITARP